MCLKSITSEELQPEGYFFKVFGVKEGCLISQYNFSGVVDSNYFLELKLNTRIVRHRVVMIQGLDDSPSYESGFHAFINATDAIKEMERAPYGEQVVALVKMSPRLQGWSEDGQSLVVVADEMIILKVITPMGTGKGCRQIWELKRQSGKVIKG